MNDAQQDPGEAPVADPGEGVGSPGDLRIGRVLGVPVAVARSNLLVVVAITAIVAPTVQARLVGIGPWRYAVSFGFAVALQVAVLLHELSHAVTARAFGMPVRGIRMWWLGGVTVFERTRERPGSDFLVALAGPAASLVVGAAAWGASRVTTAGSAVGFVVEGIAYTNIVVAVFNALPALPLDGGTMLQALVWKVTGRRDVGLTAAAWFGRALALGIVLYTARPLLQGQRLDLTSSVWGLMIAWFVWGGAGASLRRERLVRRVTALSARSLARPVVAVGSDTPLSVALERLAAAQGGGLLVVDSAGRPVGVVNEAAVSATPPERRPWVDVATVSRRLEPGLVIDDSLAGPELVARLQQTPATEYLVVDVSGAPWGVLATRDVEAAFARS